jgi:uncharacterized membrane protein
MDRPPVTVRKRTPPDRKNPQIEQRLWVLLRIGVMLAGSVVLLGAVVHLWRHASELVDYAVFRGEPAHMRTIAGILTDARAGHGRGIIQLGLLLLIATPVARVALAGYEFTRQRDWTYVFVTLIVLGCLLLSLFSGHL